MRLQIEAVVQTPIVCSSINLGSCIRFQLVCHENSEFWFWVDVGEKRCRRHPTSWTIRPWSTVSLQHRFRIPPYSRPRSKATALSMVFLYHPRSRALRDPRIVPCLHACAGVVSSLGRGAATKSLTLERASTVRVRWVQFSLSSFSLLFSTHPLDQLIVGMRIEYRRVPFSARVDKARCRAALAWVVMTLVPGVMKEALRQLRRLIASVAESEREWRVEQLKSRKW